MTLAEELLETRDGCRGDCETNLKALIDEAIERCAQEVEGYNFLEAGEDFVKPDLAARIRALKGA